MSRLDALPAVPRPRPGSTVLSLPARRPLLLGTAAVATGTLVLLRRRRRGAGGPPAPSAAGAADGAVTTAAGGTEASEREWACACGQAYRVQGVDRHRVYWLIDAGPGDPVLAPECPSCGRLLPREHEHPESVPG